MQLVELIKSSWKIRNDFNSNVILCGNFAQYQEFKRRPGYSFDQYRSVQMAHFMQHSSIDLQNFVADFETLWAGRSFGIDANNEAAHLISISVPRQSKAHAVIASIQFYTKDFTQIAVAFFYFPWNVARDDEMLFWWNLLLNLLSV